MESIVLAAERRSTVGRPVVQIRRLKNIPAVLYGHGITNANVTLNGVAFLKVYRQAGSSSLVDLVVDGGQPTKVLIHEIQRHPTTGDVIHVDLYQVRMTEKLETEIDLEFVGESPAVREQGGILVRPLDKVHVRCLPADLVPSLSVDISKLDSFDAKIHVSDLVVPPGLEILDKPEEMIANVTPPRSEEELKALDEQTVESDAVAAVGDVEKEKKPDEEAVDEAPATTEKA